MTDATFTAANETTPRPAAAPTRPFYWSVRRELWEHRSVYIAPAIAAGVVLFGFALSVVHLPHLIAMIQSEHPGHVGQLAQGYNAIAGAIMITSLIVAVTYCLGALHNERRDRSLLFWKSLPVSDLTAVLAKMSIPMVAVPVVAVVVTLATQLVVLVVASMVLASNGLSPSLIANPEALGHIFLSLFYGAIVMSLWYAPIYGWLLLVSSWARRVPFLWAILPPLAIAVIEGIAFHTHAMMNLIATRLGGGFAAAFSMSSNGSEAADYGLPHLEAAQFFTSPDLWVGLLFAAGFVAAAVWMRRRGEPI
jgi:ABC-2 type transport system permease protein